jgi:hypothetical protein
MHGLQRQRPYRLLNQAGSAIAGGNREEADRLLKQIDKPETLLERIEGPDVRASYEDPDSWTARITEDFSNKVFCN